MSNAQNNVGSPLLDRIIDAIPRLPQLSAQQKSELMTELVASNGVTTAEQREKLKALFREGAKIRREDDRIAREAAAETPVEAEPEYDDGDVAQAVAEQENMVTNFEKMVNEQRSEVEAVDREGLKIEETTARAPEAGEIAALQNFLAGEKAEPKREPPTAAQMAPENPIAA